MPMNTDHFHTHDNFKIAGKIIDQVSALKQRNAELEKENAALKAEIEMLKNHIANGDVSRITWIDELAELKEERRWRKCSEELPKDREYVLILTMVNRIFVEPVVSFGCYHKDRGEWFAKGTCGAVEVSHWMPLPKAPEGK